ncbi:30S ribosomal protein S4 [Candidatus Micrarchaeota archaeon]|nr:30S ribosomal protein S4 [Candidatus Micrarchaeota archaeon]MBI5177387.1 30S ribosomal protein S4 [Candidatus Micrarchaeota archaeon]
MGAPRRLRKLYEKPKKLWDASRLEQERKLIDEYGLKNMRELWRIQTVLRKERREARRLLAARGVGVEGSAERLLAHVRQFLLRKDGATLDDILALSVRDILERRLQTVVLRKGFAQTTAQARQFVAHGHISINGAKSTSPSRLVLFAEEPQLGWYGKPIVLEEAKEGEKAEDDSGAKAEHEGKQAEEPAQKNVDAAKVEQKEKPADGHLQKVDVAAKAEHKQNPAEEQHPQKAVEAETSVAAAAAA